MKKVLFLSILVLTIYLYPAVSIAGECSAVIRSDVSVEMLDGIWQATLTPKLVGIAMRLNMTIIGYTQLEGPKRIKIYNGTYECREAVEDFNMIFNHNFSTGSHSDPCDTLNISIPGMTGITVDGANINVNPTGVSGTIKTVAGEYSISAVKLNDLESCDSLVDDGTEVEDDYHAFYSEILNNLQNDSCDGSSGDVTKGYWIVGDRTKMIGPWSVTACVLDPVRLDRCLEEVTSIVNISPETGVELSWIRVDLPVESGEPFVYRFSKKELHTDFTGPTHQFSAPNDKDLKIHQAMFIFSENTMEGLARMDVDGRNGVSELECAPIYISANKLEGDAASSAVGTSGTAPWLDGSGATTNGTASGGSHKGETMLATDGSSLDQAQAQLLKTDSLKEDGSSAGSGGGCSLFGIGH